MEKVVLYLLRIVLPIFIFSSCRNFNTKVQPEQIDKQIVFFQNGDTNFILFHLSDLSFNLHYFKNKPQFMRIYRVNKDDSDSRKLNFRNQNKGIFVGFDTDSGFINLLGYKYLKGSEGVDISINSKAELEELTKWNDYSNSGIIYYLNQDQNGRIKTYVIDSSELKDSILYFSKP